MYADFMSIRSALVVRLPALVALLLLITTLIALRSLPAHADAGDHAAILQLQAGMRLMEKAIASDHATIAQLKERLAAKASTTTTFGPFTVSGTDVYLTGYNLHIQSGSGATDGTVNGLGNLIIGYNETQGGGKDKRTGSHNLILGKHDNYSSYSGIVAGNTDSSNGPFCSALGGQFNAASGNLATVLGGSNNSASGTYSCVSGGFQNLTTGAYSSISGGFSNQATAGRTSVVGGQSNIASTEFACLPVDSDITTVQTQITSLQATQTSQGTQITSLQGKVNSSSKITNLFALSTDSTRSDGKKNTELTLTGLNLHIVNGLGATDGNPSDPVDTGSDAVTNGLGNVIIGYNETRASAGAGMDTRTGSHNLIIGSYNNYSSFGGAVVGIENEADGRWSSAVGGADNIASGIYAAAFGGSQNSATGTIAAAFGGSSNMATGDHSSVSGGEINIASGIGSSVTGGETNTASGAYSAVDGGTFVSEGTEGGWSAGAYHTP